VWAPAFAAAAVAAVAAAFVWQAQRVETLSPDATPRNVTETSPASSPETSPATSPEEALLALALAAPGPADEALPDDYVAIADLLMGEEV
jgi:hypothetical protein